MSVVFVFGSNLAGRHGKGAALEAAQRWGAVYGKGTGRWGNSYAIPTKDEGLRTLSLSTIAEHVASFLGYARNMPGDSFLVTAVGCGLAGHDPSDIAPMFTGAPENVFLSAKLAECLTAPDPEIATAVEVERDDAEARRLYSDYTDNHPTIHCNRFPSWSELDEKTRDDWRARSRPIADDRGDAARTTPTEEPQS